ncbi:ergosterol biosynthetic protein 28 homolog isoform X4 [Lynx canadensis]|uniref:ergosterol biosynthetic protein 28 homolog isoform X4 n=1 Tax=Lynx canadensis TaxID=61383 RepID=UPI0011B0402A|nr:ergosterol biosynthetic protein 28 homolog isoform X4 [Lynx canadensis]XP_030175484.1 ergosterol biosynthetic protein 28 homolog isoform X4 [Lynx canadensis]XP_046936282.1 ergosterol biosynthetic protein 28 homolog isoform X3 [Lynx rufus]XP_046936284.1 ergosterol biosynthetic protein 28 homolog isoform X3 [Lynx rufus]
MSRFLNVLRSWLVMVSIIAMGNTLQSFRDHTFLYEKLYTGKPDLVNGLQARTFGIWTLLSSVIRCLCAIDIHNKTYAKILNNQPTLQERLKAPQRSLLLMPHSGPSLCGIPRIYLPGGRGLQSQVSRICCTTSHSGPSSSPWATSSPSCLSLGPQLPRLASWHP